MAADEHPTRAVLLDALGTLVELEPPWAHLAPALGLEPDDPLLIAAIRAEMAYYKAHAHEGTDSRALAALRARCAELLTRELGREVDVATMMSAIRFRAYADAPAALETLGQRGLALICVSNWDVSLADVLARCGLADHLDGVVSSAAAAARKPDPAIFRAALGLAGCEAREAIHVGDSAEEDVAGAAGAGVRVLLLDREGDASRRPGGPPGAAGVISSLSQIEEHLRP